MREHKDYKNILIDKILELNTAVNNKDTFSKLFHNYSTLKVCWKEIYEIAKLADAQRQKRAGK